MIQEQGALINGPEYVYFREMLHDVAEKEILESTIAAAFRDNEFDAHIISYAAEKNIIFDFSHLHTANYAMQDRFLSFFVG